MNTNIFCNWCCRNSVAGANIGAVFIDICIKIKLPFWRSWPFASSNERLVAAWLPPRQHIYNTYNRTNCSIIRATFNQFLKIGLSFLVGHEAETICSIVVPTRCCETRHTTIPEITTRPATRYGAKEGTKATVTLRTIQFSAAASTSIEV
jgi:hypothetical protein